jgi:CheY-like chemotaxis protein
MDVAPGAYVMVAVADTGTGMPPEVVQRAFEPFFTTKEAGKGSGLGLSQVYGFVKQSGGHVVAESEPGAGTTIRLYLPRSDGAVAATEPGGAAPAEVQGSERVLLIDDDAAILETTAGLLEELGYRVVRARDGREALSRLEAGETVDLVFSDIVLPGGMSGLQVAAAVSERWPRVRILLTTGYAASLAPGDERWPVLPKPYQRETLAARLREVLAA